MLARAGKGDETRRGPGRCRGRRRGHSRDVLGLGSSLEPRAPATWDLRLCHTVPVLDSVSAGNTMECYAQLGWPGGGPAG